MAASILSDNGVSSGSAGLKSTADSTGVLALQTTTSGGTATTALTIDTSQNVGIGITSPASKLDVGGNGQFTASSSQISFIDSSNSNYKWSIQGTSSAVRFYDNTASAERMRIDSSGNVGIGMTPSAWSAGRTAIQMSGSSTAVYFAGGTLNTVLANNYYYNAGDKFTNATSYALNYQQQGAGIHAWYTSSAASVSANSTATMNELMRIDSSGNLLVGTTSASGKFTVQQSTSNALAGSFVNTATTNSYVLDLQTYAVAANATLLRGFSNTSTQVLNIAGNGNITNTNNSYGPLSDVKLKENIVDATPKLQDLMRVRIVNYNLKAELGYESHKQIGVVAQELEQVFAGLVDEMPDKDAEGNDLGTTTKSVKMSVFTPMLIKAIQELKAINDTQAETINALTARVASLEGK
jgi:hypothetical protein